jgi:AcrR family transcriptional regulator
VTRATSTRPLRADAERNLARILDAAAQVFAARGFDATLHDVAAHAGLGVGTVYRRFPDKQALVEALFETKLEQIMGAAEQVARDADPWTALCGVLSTVTDAFAHDHGLHQMLNSGMYAEHCGTMAKDRLRVLLVDLLARAQANGDLRADIAPGDIPMIMIMIGTLSQKMRDFDPQISRRYLDLIFDGLRARPDQKPLRGAAPTLEEVEAAKSADW